MNIKNLKTYLDKQFDVVCFEDLSKIRNSQKAIFDLLRIHAKDYFNDNERLVFYSSNILEQSFINHIQRAVSIVGIGNFFILLINPYDITEHLKEANKRFYLDQLPIRNLMIPFKENTLPFTESNYFKDADTICALPFMNSHILQNGDVYPCCKYKTPVGNTNQKNLNEIFYNSKMVDLRQKLLNGVKPDDCEVCWNNEKNNKTSHRQHYVNRNRSQLDEVWDNRYPVIRNIEISPSNLCNFSCRICTPEFSSKVAAEYYIEETDPVEKEKIKNFIAVPFKNETNHIKTIINNSKTLENLHILGGEPFKWPNLEIVLDHLIKNNLSKKIKIELNTNGSEYSDLIVNKLLEFKSVTFLISIDDIGPRFELQRGSSWDNVARNISYYKKLQSENFQIQISPTINIQNVLYLDELVEFCNTEKLNIVWSYLEGPVFLSVKNITNKAKNLIYEKYKNHSNQELQALSSKIYQANTVNGTDFINYMQELDRRRNQNSNLVLKEIMSAMREN